MTKKLQTGNYTVVGRVGDRVRVKHWLSEEEILVPVTDLRCTVKPGAVENGYYLSNWVRYTPGGEWSDLLVGTYTVEEIIPEDQDVIASHWDTEELFSIPLSQLVLASKPHGGSIPRNINLNNDGQFVSWRLPRGICMHEIVKGTKRGTGIELWFDGKELGLLPNTTAMNDDQPECLVSNHEELPADESVTVPAVPR